MRVPQARSAAVILVLAFGGTASFAAEANSPGRTLTFDERVTAQKAIEQVYWNHRIWPKDNPGPKPPLSAVMPDDAIRAKVEDYLKKSNALDTWWHRPVTGDQLQAEMDRMAKSTRDGATLQDLYRALGNDPFVIAETLARPVLVERLIRNWYANDSRFHGALKAKAEAAVKTCSRVDCITAMSGQYHEATWRRRVDPAGNADDKKRHVLLVSAEEWAQRRHRLAQTFGATDVSVPTGRVSRLADAPEAFVVTAVLAQREGETTVASVVWPKRSFDAWWDAERPSLSSTVAQTLRTFTLPTSTSLACADDTWSPMRVNVPDPREDHAAVWTGSEMIVWGGFGSEFLNTGGRYNPSTDSWMPISTGTDAPIARSEPTAVWTGTEVIVWGGFTRPEPYYLNTGGRYDPTTDQWKATSTGANVPLGRVQHSAVWTGTEMIVWGGSGALLNTGGRYDPKTDNWTATSTTNAPIAAQHTAVWTGTEMIVWGGFNGIVPYLNTGGRYNPSTDTWIATSMGVNVPEARTEHTAVWTGTEMIVWGGSNAQDSYLNTGGRYDPTTDSWKAMPTGVNVPGARRRHSAVWTGTEMIVWGGSNGEYAYLSTGGRYNPPTDSWVPTSTGPNVPSERESHSAVWTGTEMIVWGGAFSNTGGRYNPSTDSWTTTNSVDVNVPTGRCLGTAVWTGAEMIVWGGADFGMELNSGGRYEPATDSWKATSLSAEVPSPREDHTALWTGIEMIVWGGYDGGRAVNTGGRYNPSTDRWKSTSTGANVPTVREEHAAVWTGAEMIVWGGYGVSAGTGGRYSPSTDSWLAISTDANTPEPRWGLSVVWTGTEMIVWGGYDGSNLNSGGRYNPSTDRWTSTSLGEKVPSPRLRHTAVWTGAQMIVWGGWDGNDLNTGACYDPSSDSWTPTSLGANPPAERSNHTAVWTGREMIVWGGFADPGPGAGGRYNPSTDSWTPLATGGNVPASREEFFSVWTGTELIVWGGFDGIQSGGLYCACPTPLILYRDVDGDGFGDALSSATSCDGSVPSGFVADDTDCDDANASIHPGAPESCNALDDDCDGTADNGGAALCDDANACTTDSCGGVAGCSHAFCAAADACTVDLCDLALGCVSSTANMDTTDFSANRVDGRDLVVLANAWDSCPGDASYNSVANLDRGTVSPDSCIGDADFHLFMTTFGRGCP